MSRGRLVAMAALVAALAAAPGVFGWRVDAAGGFSPSPAQKPAGPARETFELSGEAVEYDANRRVTVVTGGPGNPAMLVSGRYTVSGARLEYDLASGKVKVEGGVRLESGEPDRFELTARALTADLRARTAQAQGEVRFSSGKASATAGEAFYQGKERQVLLRGDPKVQLEGNVLTGQEIVFFLAEQRVKVQGRSRATVVVDQAGPEGE